jgi:PAS domain S-box-containing protein
MKKKIRCWEFFECNEKECPVYKSKELKCWLISGTHCRDEIQGRFLEKIEMCLECEPFKANIDTHSLEETLKVVSGQFTQSRCMIEERDRELEHTSMEMALGLSEVFEALKQISSGDSLVRIPEASELELITKLKHIVNLTAQNLAEIVDLSHEFAIGLAEHFDVLHRVSEGDLNARVSGTSQVELLESLKKVTNHMIDSVSREIAEREQAEEALTESEEKYRTQFEEALDGIFLCDAETGILIDCNQAGAELVGRAKSELVGKHQRILHPPEELEGEFSRTFKKHLKGKEGQALEAQVLTKNGEKRDVSIKANMFVLKGKNVLQGTFRDIHERKEAEEAKVKLQGQLRQTQKMEAIGTLAGGIAHDFNNILFPIVGYTEMTMDDAPDGSEARINLEEVLKAANRAKDLVKQILAFSRHGEQEAKPLKIQSIIKEALKLLRASLPSTIEISQNIDEECGGIVADPTKIHQVMMNLCTNAYHAMREKGGVLGVTLTEGNIDPGDLISDFHLNPGPYVRLTVSDTGHGMDPAVIDRIFEPYFTTKEVGDGTGMGLSVVHRIVKDCGGDIRVYSEPGEGTTFHVYLPRIDTSAIAPETVPTEPAPRGKEHILFVDDEEQIVHMVRQMLERLGYHVTGRTSSVEALQAFRAQPEKFDLVITDQTMPNMTGAALATKLLGIRPDTPIILCTGFSEVISEKKAKSVGIRGYVMKPVVQTQIANTIRQVLDQEKET